MDEKAPHGDHQHQHRGHQCALHALGSAQTEDVDRNQAAQANESIIDRMRARTD